MSSLWVFERNFRNATKNVRKIEDKYTVEDRNSR